MTDIPRIIEKADPGFREMLPDDFIEVAETVDQLVKRKELTNDIVTECQRLNLSHSLLQFLLHQSTGATTLANLSVFDVMLFRDYLRRLEATNGV